MGRVGLAVRGLMGVRYILEGFEAVLRLGFTLWEMEDRRSLETDDYSGGCVENRL